jgi:hypothetical protein
MLLVAAGMDSDSLGPNRKYGLSPSQSEAIVTTRNASDPALHWYPLMYRRLRGPQALGYTGPTCSGRVGNVLVVNVTSSVGRNHSWSNYLCSSCVSGQLAWAAFADAPILAAP